MSITNKTVRLLLVLATATILVAQTQRGQIYPPPTTTYTIASPRMSISRQVLYRTDENGEKTESYGLPHGAVVNFPRKNGSLKVPLGVRVIFCLSRSFEGVWYENTYGLLATSVKLQRYQPPTDSTNEGSWVDIGEDKASEIRTGPSVARAKVGVPVVFRMPGEYLIRAVVHTVAKPMHPNALTDQLNSSVILPEAVKKDVILTRVKVVDQPIIQVRPDEDATEDPDLENIVPMLKETDADLINMLSADINSDGLVDMIDLILLSQQWGREQEIPLTNID